MAEMLKLCLKKSSNFEFFRETRLVYDGPDDPSGAPPEGAGQSPEDLVEPMPKDGQFLADRGVYWKDQWYKTDEELKQLEGEGESKDYIDFLNKSTDYFYTYAASKMRGLAEQTPDHYDFVTHWKENPGAAADFIEQVFPIGPGRVKFLDALRKPNIDDEHPNPEYDTAKTLLDTLTGDIDSINQELHNAEKLRLDVMGGGGGLSEKVKGSISNFMERYHEGDAGQKVLAVGAVLVGLKLLLYYKDQPIPGMPNVTWGEAGMWGAAAVALNQLTGMVRDDGRDVLDMLEVDDPLAALKQCTWHAFALDGKNEKMTSPDSTRVMLEFADKDMRKILDHYDDAETRGKKKFTADQLEDIGFTQEQAEAYSQKKVEWGGVPGGVGLTWLIVHKLMMRLGKNFARDQRYKFAMQNKQGPAQLEKPGDEDWGMWALKVKYLEGPQAYKTWTFEEVMTGEVLEIPESEIMQNALDHDASLLPQQTWSTVQATAESMKASATAAAAAVWDKANRGYNIISERMYGWAHKGWQKFREVTGFQEAAALADEAQLNGMIPATEGLHIKVVSEGSVEVMGVRMDYTRTGEPGDADVKYNITGLEFVRKTTDQTVNDVSIASLKAEVKKRVTNAIKDKDGITAQHLNNLSWDKNAQVWKISKVNVRSYGALGIGGIRNGEITIEGAPDALELKFNGHPIEDFKNLETMYHKSVIREAVYDAYPALKNLGSTTAPYEGVEVEVLELVGRNVKLRIGGQEFPGTGKVALASLSASDIQSAIGSENLNSTFIEARLEKLAGDPEFNKPFEDLRDTVESFSKMGFGEALDTLFDQRIAWVLPGSLDNAKAALGVVGGKIQHERFRYLMDFKRFELVAMLGENLNGKTLDNLGTSQQDIIDYQLDEIKKMYTEFDGRNDNDKKTYFLTMMEDMTKLGYSNAEYKTAVDTLHQRIQQGGYNFFGLDRSNLPVAGTSAHESYEIIMYVWSEKTRDKYARNPNTLSPSEVAELNGAIQDIIKGLDKAKRETPTGVITARKLKEIFDI